MSLPEVVGTPNRLYQRYIAAARAQLRDREEMRQRRMPEHPQGADGRVVPKSEFWRRDDYDGAERHLPYLLGARDDDPVAADHFDSLSRQARQVLIFTVTLFVVLLWGALGWGWAGAATLALSVVFYRYMFS
jgi:hypothetical protein